MRVYLPIILAVLALVAVAHAEENYEGSMAAKKVMKGVASIQKFFNEDPTGQTLKEILMKIKELGSQVRTKIRAGLKSYVKKLLEE
nr:Tapeworm specific antigen B [Hymenolepis microstoma]